MSNLYFASQNTIESKKLKSAGYASQYCAIANNNSPSILAYPWDNTTGFGAKYTDPSSGVTGGTFYVAFNPNNTVLAAGLQTSPNVAAWAWSSSGFGTRFANPSTLPAGPGRSFEFHPDGTSVLVGVTGANPSVVAYTWSDVSGFGTKYADPSTMPGNSIPRAIYNKTGNCVAVCYRGTTSPYIRAYPWGNATGFGTVFANASTAVPSQGYGLDFNSIDTALTVAHETSPFFTAYSWSNSTGFGTKYSNPTLPSSITRTEWNDFNSTDTVVGMTTNSTVANGRVIAYGWTNAAGFGTKYADPITGQSSSRFFGRFSRDGAAFCSAGNTPAPTVDAYSWTDSAGFGTRYATPGSLPAANSGACTFN